MSFRQVIVKDSKYISLKDNNILAKYDIEDYEVKIPIEDVAIVLIESDRTTISIKLINKLSEYNIVIIVCDETKKPASIIMPMLGHYRQLEIFYLQLEFKEVNKQNLWREIIKQKIRNQRDVLRLIEAADDSIEKLEELYTGVKRNDATNREALAARIFFEALYGSEFKRFVDDKINNALNFGYTIIVGSIIRQLVSFGLDTKLGIWHRSKSNSFNLAYDLIEPFRPIVDYFIVENYEFLNKDLSPMLRKKLVGLLNVDILVEGEKYRLQNAIEIFVKEYMKIIRKESTSLPNIAIMKTFFND